MQFAFSGRQSDWVRVNYSQEQFIVGGVYYDIVLGMKFEGELVCRPLFFHRRLCQ